MKIFAFGASILTSYWNGAATYYRGCYKYLARQGHEITFVSPDAFDRKQHHDAGDFSFVYASYYAPTPAGMDEMLELAAGADVVVKALAGWAWAMPCWSGACWSCSRSLSWSSGMWMRQRRWRGWGRMPAIRSMRTCRVMTRF